MGFAVRLLLLLGAAGTLPLSSVNRKLEAQRLRRSGDVHFLLRRGMQNALCLFSLSAQTNKKLRHAPERKKSQRGY